MNARLLTSIILEAVIAICGGVIVWKFSQVDRDLLIRKQSGWRYIYLGFIISLFASILDFSDNFPALNHFVILGDTEPEALLEKLGFLAGYFLMAIGFWHWLPAIRDREHFRADLSIARQDLVTTSKKALISEKKYRAIAKAAKDAILVMNRAGHIVYLNPAGWRMFGYRQAEMLGLDLHSLLAPTQNHPAFKEGFDKVLTTGISQALGRTIEAVAVHKEGREFPIEVSLSSVEWEGDEHVLGLVRDISERQALEREKGVLYEQLLQAQKMEAVGTLAGGIAHDFNNVLTAIQGYTLLSKDKMAELCSQELDGIMTATRRARDLVNQILTFSRKKESRLQPLRLQPLVKEIGKMLAATVPKTIALQFRINSDAVVIADPTQIHQLLLNLCTNAIQAMDNRGLLEISLQDGAGAEEKNEPMVLLTVKDSGQGMNQETLAHIFDPFFTTKEAGQGTGLGMAVVHGIVESHKGTIHIDSTVGKGTKVTVALPASATAVAAEASHDHGPLRGTERVLLVDDEAMLLAIWQRQLVNLGYRVTCAINGSIAMEQYAKDPKAFDVVITDQHMPGMSGEELALQIKGYASGTKVLLATGFMSGDRPLRGEIHGIDKVLLKPFTFHVLAGAIRDLFEEPGRRGAMASEISQ